MSTSSKRTNHSGQVAKREGKRHKVSIADHLPGLLNHDNSQIDECVVVVNTVSEQESACSAAHSHVEKEAPGTERAKAAFVADLDVLSNAKMIEVLQRAFRIQDDDKYPLFLSPSWMRDGLTGIAVGTLSNIYAECQKAEDPGTWPGIDREQVDQMLELCSQHFDDDIPELVLAQHSREWLTQWIVMASYFLQQERRETAILVAEAIDLIGDGDAAWKQNAQAHLVELPECLLAAEAPDQSNDAED